MTVQWLESPFQNPLSVNYALQQLDRSELVSHFPKPLSVHYALQQLDRSETTLETTFKKNGGFPTVHDVETQQDEIVMEGHFILGRDEALDANVLGDVRTIRCKTFLALGRIELDTLKVFAENILILSKVFDISGNQTFYAVGGTVAMLGAKASGVRKIFAEILWETEVINIKERTEQTVIENYKVLVDGQYITFATRAVTKITQEESLDKAVSRVRHEVFKQMDWDLYNMSRDHAQAMGLRSILV